MLSRGYRCFPFGIGCAFAWGSFLLLRISAMDTPEQRSIDYGYNFKVTSVERCPMNISEHEKAEARLGCKENQGYHCIPDKYHSTLIEFCYPKKRILVHTGNCLELADIGILNHVKCQTFSCGCPEAPYYSNEIYKYPVCLDVALDCFTSDIACLKGKSHRRPFEKFRKDCEHNRTDVFLAPFIVLTIIVALQLVLVLFFCILKRRDVLAFVKGNKASARLVSFEGGSEEQTCLIMRPHDEGTFERKCMVPKGFELPSLTLDLEELESEHWLEDMELLLLLRRHCSDGAFENFDYLLTTRILRKENEKILESRDRNGCSLMHYAAKGGSVDILETLLKHCSDRKLDEEDRFGHTLLHIACKFGRNDICTFLLSRRDYIESEMEKTTNQLWNAAHFTAAGGNSRIFELLLTKNFPMNSKTINRLNILDIACIYNHTSFCKELIKRSSELKLLLHESDERGWNIAHIAARAGNKDILEFLINGYLDVEIVKSKTYQKKTILHICCEYGHYELCKFIVENEHLNNMLGDIDQDRWNALHFCAKGGSLDAFKFIESKNVCTSDDKTKDSKTALHISCIHKHVEIAKYLCDELKSTGKNINDLKTKTLWTAAHYVAVEIKQDGTEEKLIGILKDAGIDLNAKTTDRRTVLIVACEHRNKRLVRYLVKKHPELLEIETDLLKKEAACDAEIKDIIDNAFKKSS